MNTVDTTATAGSGRENHLLLVTRPQPETERNPAAMDTTNANDTVLYPEAMLVTPQKPDWESHLVTITPALASYWIEHCRYPGQRHLREHHVLRLMRAHVQDKLQGDELTFYNYGEGPKCVNGMHRLHTIVRTKKPLIATVTMHDHATRAATEAAYRRFDQGLPRNFSDALRASSVLESVDEADNLTLHQANMISSASLLIGCEFDTSRQSTDYAYYRDYDNRLKLTQDWLSAGIAYFKAIAASRKWLRRALHTRAVAGVGLVTFRDQADDAALFWQKVAENSGLERRDPAHSLVTYLGVVYHSTLQVNRHSRAVASCWNAFYEGRTINQPRVDDPHQPIKILGTRFEKRGLTSSEIQSRDEEQEAREPLAVG